MWVWLYGLAISIFLIFQEIGSNNIISLIPLILLSLLAALELIFRVIKYPKCEQWEEWLNTGFLFSLSFALLLMISLQIENHVSFSTFFVILTITVAILSLLYLVLKGQIAIFVSSPLYLRIGNMISYTSSVATYLCFYGVEYNSIDAWIPLLPFGISVLAEVYIFWTLYKGIDGVQDSFTKKASFDRLTYMICVSILMICAILHYTVVTDDLFLYSAAAISYFIGICIVLIRSKRLLCRNINCCKKAKYLELKSDDINPEEGVTNNGDE